MTNEVNYQKAYREVGYILEKTEWKLPRDYELETALGPRWNGLWYAWSTLIKKSGLRKALTLVGVPEEELRTMDWYSADIYRLWLALDHRPSLQELRQEYGESWVTDMMEKLGSMSNAILIGGEVDNYNVDTRMKDKLYSKELVAHAVRRFVERNGEPPYATELDQLAPWHRFWSSREACLAQCLK